MKIVKTPAIREVSEIICDNCKELAVSSLDFSFYYGSVHDMHKLTIDLCDECSDTLLEELKNKYPKSDYKECSI